ncbi:MAG: AAA domain-containing protein [Bacteroidetes bacterium]|nr:AAA domain-containing protein [Bacteroidota bacterium]
MNHLIQKYRSILDQRGLSDEIYKWDLISSYRGRPDLTLSDLGAEMGSIKYENLVYQMAPAMTKRLAEFDPVRYRKILEDLVDESVDLQLRINRFMKDAEVLSKDMDPNLSSHHDERTASVLLTYHNPDLYTFYKYSYYKKFCELLGEVTAGTGKNYVHYLKLLKNFRDEFVITDFDLLKKVDSILQNQTFKDGNRLLLCQDILFQTLERKDNNLPASITQLNYRILARILGNKNEERVRHFFNLIRLILEHIKVDTNDPRLAFNPRNDSTKIISISIGSYRLTSLTDSGKIGFCFKKTDWLPFENEIEFNVDSALSSQTEVIGLEMDYSTYLQNENSLNELALKSADYLLNRYKTSTFHAHHVEEIARLALNPDGLQPYFDATPQDLSNLKMLNYTRQPESVIEMNKSVNKIFFGPPGTGKTFLISKQIISNYTTTESSISKTKFQENIIKELKWWQVLGMVLLDVNEAKVQEISEHPWIKQKASFSNAKNLRANLWGILQERTPLHSQFVKVQEKRPPFIFDKDVNSVWRIIPDTIENEAPEILEAYEKVKSYSPDPDKIIKRYSLTTFHQSFTYEDFIEGIKPVLDEEESDKQLRYEIQDGIFKTICNEARNDPDNRYAILIDEINRGNVAAIFGELITLIEEDKREGTPNALSVILPYSKQTFSVPANLDIYGTMNTADRSVEALDTALRRRFIFEEMVPDPELIRTNGKLENGSLDGMDLVKLLTTINARIEILLDRDHLIGHSYFLSVASWEDLEQVFFNKIIPLLQEYFYGDYGKIGLVLGNGFVTQHNRNPDKFLFAKFDYEDVDELSSRIVYRILHPTGVDFIAAVEDLFA